MKTSDQKLFKVLGKDKEPELQKFTATLSLSVEAYCLEQAQEIVGMFLIDNNLENDCEILSLKQS